MSPYTSNLNEEAAYFALQFSPFAPGVSERDFHWCSQCFIDYQLIYKFWKLAQEE